jgi:hypothetical protein
LTIFAPHASILSEQGRKAPVCFKEGDMPTEIATDSIPCSTCHYPIPKAEYVGQQVKCAYCGTIHEAIAQSTVTIPTAILIGVFSFLGGTLFGHAALVSARGGSAWLAGKAEKHFKK